MFKSNTVPNRARENSPSENLSFVNYANRRNGHFVTTKELISTFGRGLLNYSRRKINNITLVIVAFRHGEYVTYSHRSKFRTYAIYYLRF